MELTMLKKFETKTNRVKGLAFHPYRPWILVSLHNGSIQLYDYRMEILLKSFEEHDGPVRGIDFHKTQPLFVSGGDDYKVKVWNYQLSRCLYTLHGHLDYIRTVFFHPKDQPWVLSASDDQTVRIWNWQSRTCLAVLTGHNHYVMCAQWHPSEDLILSASLDQTIRVWDISGLRKRNTSIINEQSNSSSNDVFGSVDAVVKFVLEGHSRGVNWAAFHPNNNLVVSGADDREVKVWRMSGSRAWETTTYRGHLNNVSCVLFHPKENVIISNSEDKTLRIWDVARNYAPLCFRRESDRYWILAAHPRLNLLAAGHDNGMLIFKLSRERPPFWYSNNETILYWSDGYIRSYNLNNQRHEPLLQTRSASASGFGTRRLKRPRRLLYNPYSSNKEHNILLFYSGEDSEYELYTMDRKGNSQAKLKSAATSVAFVTRNRFAVLDGLGEIALKNMENESKRKIKIPERSANYIFYGGAGRLLLRSPEWITLFDVAARKIIREIQIPSRFPIKFVSWSHDFSKVALLARFSVMICDSELNDICTIYENAKVKSGVWDKNGVFVYTTVTHMKYALETGDHGIIKTLDQVLYVSCVRDDEVHCMTRESTIKIAKIDNTEYVFKKALTERRYGDVQRLIEEGKLRGESIISYLQSKGFPEVALRFVEEVTTRFELALECGNIDDAFECARKIGSEKVWNRFGQAALMQGNYRYVTEAYKQTLNFEKLMYLFVLTGNYPMLDKLSTISKNRDDRMMIFNIALLNGDIKTRIETLEQSGQTGLAYLTALSNGLTEEAEKLKEKIGDKNIRLPRMPNNPSDPSTQLTPPKPIWGPWTDDEKYDWPHIEIRRGFFDKADIKIKTEEEHLKEQKLRELQAQQNLESGSEREDNDDFDNANNDDQFGFEDWNKEKNDDDEFDDGSKKGKKGKGKAGQSLNSSTVTSDEPFGGDDIDFKLSDDDEDDNEDETDANITGTNIGGGGIGGSYFQMPKHGSSFCDKWAERAQTASDMIASGKFDLAQENLHRQFGIVNFEPLKEYFLKIFTSSHAELALIPNSSDISVGLRRQPSSSSNNILPAIGLSLSHCHDYIKMAYGHVSKGEFESAIALFRKVLHIIPLLIIETSDELKDVRQCIKICREYINASRVYIEAKDTNKNNDIRRFELYCYFTHFDLQDGHIFSGLYLAMKSGYTTKNFHTTAVICRRLLELSVSVRSEGSEKIVNQAKKVLKKCEKNNAESSENEDKIEYKAHDFNQLCCMSLRPIDRGEKFVKSPYCQSVFKEEYDGKLSPVCQIVRIGANAPGVTITK